MISTLVTMATVSLACMVFEKVCYEIGKPNHAQYVSLAGSSALALTALMSALKLVEFIGGM